MKELLRRFLIKAKAMLIKSRFDLLSVFLLGLLSFVIAGRGLLNNQNLNAADIFYDRSMYGGDNQAHNPNLSDSPMLHYPSHFFFWENLKQGNWADYKASTLLGNSGGGVSVSSFPFTIPSLFSESGTGITISTMIILCLNGIFMYIFIRSVTKSWLAALFAGIVWTLCAHQISWLMFPQHLATNMWLPLLFLGYLKLLKNKKLFNMIFTICILFLFLHSGYSQLNLYVLIYLAIFVFIYLIYELVKSKNVKSIIKTALFILVTTMIPLLLIVGSVSKGSKNISSGLRGTQESRLFESCEICTPSKFLSHATGFTSPDIYGNSYKYEYQGPYTNIVEYSRYFGIIPLLLLILIPFIRKNRFLAIAFVSISTLFILFMYSVPPFGSLFKLIPFVSFGQYTRMITIVLFGFITGSSLVVGNILSSNIKIPRKIRQAFGNISILAGIIILLSSIPQIHKTVVNIQNNSHLLKTYLTMLQLDEYPLFLRNALFLGLGFIIFGFILLFQKEKSKQLIKLSVILIILFTFFDLGRFSFYFNTFTKNKYEFPKFPGMEILLNDPDYYRVHISTDDYYFFPSNTNVIYGIEWIEGYNTVITNDYIDIYKSAFDNVILSNNGVMFSDDIDSEILDLFNIKYVISSKALPCSKNLSIAYQDNNLTIYQNKDFLQRIFSSNDFIVENNFEKTKEQLLDPAFNENETIILSEDPNFTPLAESKQQAKINDIKIYVESTEARIDDPDGGWIVFSQMYDPKWHLYVDGKESEIYKANGLLMASYIEPGNHHIQFKYEDISIFSISGAKILLFTLILVISLWRYLKTNNKKWILIIVMSTLVITISSLPIVLDKPVLFRSISKYPWKGIE